MTDRHIIAGTTTGMIAGRTAGTIAGMTAGTTAVGDRRIVGGMIRGEVTTIAQTEMQSAGGETASTIEARMTEVGVRMGSGTWEVEGAIAALDQCETTESTTNKGCETGSPMRQRCRARWTARCSGCSHLAEIKFLVNRRSRRPRQQ